MSRNSPEDHAIGLLVLWWRYESGWLPVDGFPRECPSCSDYLTSRQYDGDNGAFETDERGRLAMSIGHLVNAMAEPHRTALYIIARNRATGVSEWQSDRLPQDKDDCAEVCATALAMFAELV